MNTLLEGPSRMTNYTGFGYTNIALVFQAFAGRQKEFNWLITNFEGHGVGDGWGTCLPDIAFGKEPKIVSGLVLTEVVEQIDIQFIWGNLSAFAPDVKLDVAQMDVVPWADGNRMFWSANVAPQHPQATVEIVCFDSSLTLLLSKDNDLSQRFRAFFPESIDLDQHNRERGQQANSSR